MSLLDIASAEASHLFTEVQPEFQQIAALVWRDAKAVGGHIGSPETLGVKELNALRDIALQVVTNTEKDPNF